MAKPKLRIKARQMRSRGESVNVIAKKLSVSKGTVSLWVRDIILTIKQLEKLQQRSIKGAELGRLKGAFKQKQKRLQKISYYEKSGVDKFSNLSSKEFFAAGIALYWAEGSKKDRSIRFCNSDPVLVNFMITWLRNSFGVEMGRLSVNVGINEIHRSRKEIVKKYWSTKTGIPLGQFRKTSFKKSKNKKVYLNHNQHFGTLDVRVLKPGELYYKILGLIVGLGEPGRRPASRGAS